MAIIGFLQLPVSADIHFSSRRLHDLYYALPDSIKTNCQIFSNADAAKCTLALPAVYSVKDQSGSIQHIGLAFIKNDLRAGISNDLMECIERLLLETTVCRDTVAFKKLFFAERIHWTINGQKITVHNFNKISEAASIVRSVTGFSIKNEQQKLIFLISGENNSGLIVEMQSELSAVRGMDKAELDRALYKTLINAKNDSIENPDSSVDSEYKKVSDSLYVLKGTTLEKDITTDSYYFKNQKGKYRLVVDSSRFSQTSRDIFLVPTSFGKRVVLHVTQRSYANSEITYDVKLTPFLNVFRKSHIKYFGIENESPSEIKAILVIKNTDLNFLHLVSMTINKTNLFSGTPEVSLVLHSHIPSHNVERIWSYIE